MNSHAFGTAQLHLLARDAIVHRSGHGGFGAGLGIAAAIAVATIGAFVTQTVRGSKNRIVATQSAAASLPSPQAARPQFDAVPEALARLRADDHAFEPETSLQRAETTYSLAGRALQRRDASALRPLFSPELFMEWSARIRRTHRTASHARVDRPQRARHARAERAARRGRASGGRSRGKRARRPPRRRKFRCRRALHVRRRCN